MEEMGGLRKRMPLTFIAFLFSTLALAGVPPFVGFWSKDLIITELSLANMNIQALLVLVVSMLTAYYMFRALFKVFFGPESKMAQEKDLHEAPKIMTIPLMILSACVVVLGFSEECGSGPAWFDGASHLRDRRSLVPPSLLSWSDSHLPTSLST